MSLAASMRFTFLACADLRRTWDGIAMPRHVWSGSAPDRLVQAQDFAAKFSHHCELLAANPELGTEHPELLHGMRSSSFQKLVIYYRSRGEVIEVLRVLRAADPV